MTNMHSVSLQQSYLPVFDNNPLYQKLINIKMTEVEVAGAGDPDPGCWQKTTQCEQIIILSLLLLLVD